MGKRVFLSGAIEGATDLSTGWRAPATKWLNDIGFTAVSPLINTAEQVFFSPNEIVHRNESLQRSCDLLLVEYTILDRSYISTDYELVRARDWHQPAIVFAHEEYKNRMYLQYLATAILPNINEALDYICAYY
jgi:hypothetical protein